MCIKISSPQPNIGDKIQLTWLPNPINNPAEKSCYIGTIGVVDTRYPNGGFDLRTESGAILMVGITQGKKYQYKKLN